MSLFLPREMHIKLLDALEISLGKLVFGICVEKWKNLNYTSM